MSSTNFRLRIPGYKMGETILNIYNLTGVLVKSKVVNSNHSQINLSGCKQGIYLVRCGNSAERIVIMK